MKAPPRSYIFWRHECVYLHFCQMYLPQVSQHTSMHSIQKRRFVLYRDMHIERCRGKRPKFCMLLKMICIAFVVFFSLWPFVPWLFDLLVHCNLWFDRIWIVECQSRGNTGQKNPEIWEILEFSVSRDVNSNVPRFSKWKGISWKLLNLIKTNDIFLRIKLLSIK